jgi:hypothetical protein
MIRQIHIDAKHILPAQPMITPRDQMRHLCKNIDTKTDSTYDNILSKANDVLSGSKVTKRDVDKIRNELIRHADKKFPDTNFLPTAFSSIINDPRGNASVYMASQFANSNANMQMMGAEDAAAVDGTGSSASCWQCGKNGHIRRDCPDNKGNGSYVDRAMAGLLITPVLVFRTLRVLHWEFLRLWTGFELSSSWADLPGYGLNLNRNILDFMSWHQIDLGAQDLNDIQRPKSFQKIAGSKVLDEYYNSYLRK